MEIIKANIIYIDEAVALAQHEYEKECHYVSQLYSNDFSFEIKKGLINEFMSGRGYLCLEKNEVLGFMIYYTWENKNEKWLLIPIYGYGAVGEKREKILSQLFAYIARDICINNNVHFNVKLYAHDSEAIELFSNMEFGRQCTENIIFTDSVKLNSIMIYRELNKKDMPAYEEKVVSLFMNIVEHLKESPIFYKGEEFTKEAYRSFISEKTTRVFGAFDGNRLIGVMDASQEGNSFINSDEMTWNTGDIFIEKNTEKKGLQTVCLPSSVMKCQIVGLDACGLSMVQVTRMRDISGTSILGCMLLV